MKDHSIFKKRIETENILRFFYDVNETEKPQEAKNSGDSPEDWLMKARARSNPGSIRKNSRGSRSLGGSPWSGETNRQSAAGPVGREQPLGSMSSPCSVRKEVYLSICELDKLVLVIFLS